MMPPYTGDNSQWASNDNDDGTGAGAYFCMNMMLITLSSFLAVIVISAHIRGDRRNQVPRWLKAVRADDILFHFLSYVK